MNKAITTLNLDRECIQLLKQRGVNISALVNNILRQLTKEGGVPANLLAFYVMNDRYTYLQAKVPVLRVEVEALEQEYQDLAETLPKLKEAMTADTRAEREKRHMQIIARRLIMNALHVDRTVEELESDPSLLDTYEYLKEITEDIPAWIESRKARLAQYS